MEEISKVVEKHFKTILILFATIVIAVPVIMYFIYNECFNRITADGMLSYVGAIITGATTLFVACVSLYQSQRSSEMNDELMAMQRRDKIRPALQMKLHKKDDDLFEIEISNTSCNYAYNIHLFEYLIVSEIKGYKTTKKNIVLGERTVPNAINIYDTNYYTNCEGYPKIIWLIFDDMDNNMLVQEFKLTANNRYVSTAAEYDICQ